MAPKLGIIAGSGDLPKRVIEACRRESRPHFVLGIEGQTDPATLDGVEDCDWCRLGNAGKALRLMHEKKIEELVMAGAVRRPSIAALRPDLDAIRVIARAGRRAAFGDDSLLSAVVHEIERHGVKVVGPDEIVGDLRPKAGVLGKHRPSERDHADIARGIGILEALSACDVGQAVVVQDNLVLGVEAIEGTDALVARAGGLRRPGPGGVLVKIRKRGQETRVDLPAVGLKTVQGVAEAGLRGIAVEADGSLFLERAEAIAFADANGLFLIAVTVD